MLKFSGLFLAIALAAAAPIAAQNLAIPEQTRAGEAQAMPKRGMTMLQVERTYGEPAQRRSPVGDPPITRWEYDAFIVYFENKHVIHSVWKR